MRQEDELAGTDGRDGRVGDGPPPAGYLAVIEALLDDVENLVESMVASYHTQIPSYRAVRNRALFPQIRAASKAHAVLILTRMAEGRPLTPGDLKELGTLGKLRYEQGIPLADLAEAYKWGARVVERHLLQGFSGPEGEFPAYEEWVTEEIRRHTSHAGIAISQAYLEAKQGMRDRAERGGRLFEDLLEIADDRRAVEAAIHFGFRPEDKLVVALVDPVGCDAEPTRSRLLIRLTKPCKEGLGGVRHCVANAHKGRLAIVAGFSEPRRSDLVAADLAKAVLAVKTLSKIRMVVGAGAQAESLEGLRASYRQAVQTVDVAMLLDMPSMLTFENAVPYIKAQGWKPAS